MAAGTQEISADQALALAVRYHQAGDIARAKSIYLQLTEIAPAHPDAWHFLGVIALQEGDAETAEILIRQALALYGSSPNPDCSANLASALMAMGNFKEAIVYLGDALQRDPENAALLSNMGNAVKALGNIDGAMQYYETAFRKDPLKVDFGHNLALACQEAGHYPRAAEIYRDFFDRQLDTPGMTRDFLACLEKINRADVSRRYAEEAFDRYPDDAGVIASTGWLALSMGDVEAAIGSFEMSLDLDPGNRDGALGMATAYLRAGLFDEAKELFLELSDEYPEDPLIKNNLGLIYVELEEFDDAQDALLDAIDFGLDDYEPLVNLATLFMRKDKNEIALIHLENAARLCRSKVENVRFGASEDFRLGRLKNTMHLLEAMEQIDQLLSQIHGKLVNPTKDRHARVERLRLRIDRARFLTVLAKGYEKIDEAQSKHYEELCSALTGPLFWELNDMLGYLQASGDGEVLVALLEFAKSLYPDHGAFFNLIGLAYLNLARGSEAEKYIREAIAVEPENSGYHNNLGLSLQRQMRHAESAEAFKRAIEIAPDYMPAHAHLGFALADQGLVVQAAKVFQTCVELEPNHYLGWDGLSAQLSTIGRFDEASIASMRLIELRPSHPMHSNALFRLQYDPAKSGEEIRDQILAWGEVFAGPHYHKQKPLHNVPDPDRKLRIGYLGPDFRGHSSAYFLHSLFKDFDRNQFEVYGYANVPLPDQWTSAFASMSTKWCNTSLMTDDQIADKIREDGVDILMELGSHTADSRSLVIAQRPAPIQVSYIGIGNTTGVLTTDYFLADNYMVPEGFDHLFGEQIWRLPRNLYCYSALNPMPDVGPLPAKSNGYVTFGCFARSIRYNELVFKTWADLLLAVPNSRLMLNTKSCLDPDYRDIVRTFFRSEGVDPDRLDLVFTTPTAVTWDTYNKVDIALDPYPHNAGLTTYEALYMGAIVVTLADRPPQGRYGSSILNNLGYPELVAQSSDEYVRIASDLASDLDKLAAIRAGLRQKMLASPLCDGEGFMRDLEQGFRQMWQRWCEEQRSLNFSAA